MQRKVIVRDFQTTVSYGLLKPSFLILLREPKMQKD